MYKVIITIELEPGTRDQVLARAPAAQAAARAEPGCLAYDFFTCTDDPDRLVFFAARDRYGVRAVIHPHAGGYIEFADELDRIAGDLAPDLAGLCLDTGHLDYAGMDPVAAVRACADRLDYIHFKDIDAGVHADAMTRRIRFFDACAEGVMCPIGRGRINYPAIHRLLREIGYGGYITIEQERDPRNVAGSLADLAASCNLLREQGF